jgi:osmoprotectant transport system ATP-binding protein
MFDLDAATVNHDGVTALAPTTLSIARGERVAVIGPSGSGKSTLLRVLAGLAPAAGVRFDGAPVDDWRSLRLRLGYVIQDGGLFPHLTGRDNVALMAVELGWPRARIDARLAELRGLAGITGAELDRFPAELSGGQRQRLALMRALMLDPDVLLLDEPLSALDPITRARLADELRSIFDALAKTVVIVTHNLAEARFFAPRIVLMQSGRVVQDAPFETLETAPAAPFVAEFIAAERAL